ncbi:hypothetical protein LT337_32575 (plasmid) [Mycolicibacterium fortuitum]|nr:hypothetical protein LT337_32575 [Mycolicibacterium fortuitum]
MALVDRHRHRLAEELPGIRRLPENLHRIITSLGQKIPVLGHQLTILMQRIKPIALQRLP